MSRSRVFSWLPVAACVIAVFAIVSARDINAGISQEQELLQGDLSTIASTGTAQLTETIAYPETEVFAEELTWEQIVAQNEAIRTQQQVFGSDDGPKIVPVPVGNTANTTALADTPETMAADPSGGEGVDPVPSAAGDFAVQFQHDLTAGEVATSQRSAIHEPMAIRVGTSAFYTANWYAAKSTNSGSTWTYINPYTFFPSVDGGFCCDQVVGYAPAQDMAIWGLQYVKDASGNKFRIARSIGQAGIAANSWTYWTLDPTATFGFAATTWLDYPSMTVGTTYLYMTSNVFTQAGSYVGNVVYRISLAQLKAGGTISIGYYKPTSTTQRLTEGAGSTMYSVGFESTTQMKIYSVTDAGSVTSANVNLNAFNYLNRNGVSTSPDSTNWAARADSRPTAAYVANNVIGVMWTARQGTGRAHPYVVHARFNQSTKALISQADIWNSGYAWMYPSAAPNSLGHLAGTMQIGGATSGTFAYPGTQGWITDPTTGASNTVGAFMYISSSNDGPNANVWGDYFGTRVDKANPGIWVGASHTLQGGGSNGNAVPKFFVFGRSNKRAAMTSPANGSTLTGSSTTFSWTTGAGALQYWLYAGTTAGSNNLYSASQGTATSKTLTGLPTNGSNLYVRLWTRFASGWQYNDYVYKNSTVVNIKAAITSPTPGGTLTSSSTTFTWNTGSGALQYWLYVGTSAGANNVYSASQGTALSKTVTGIPLGGTIYVRLWTQFTTGWFYTDYSYSSGAKAVITSPSLGSTLAGSSQTFNWSTGSGAVAYWLYVGTSGYGSSNIVSAGTGLVTSKVVTGLPLTGVTVYARLWTYFSGTGWVYNDYWYKAASAAVMSSPTPGTTLTGSKVTFAWAAGGGSVNQYYIYVGTSLGNSNIYYSSAGTSLSHAVPGIPTTGITVYVRLWTRILTTWVYRDYAYKAATGVSAADMLNPVPGSAIGTSATFSWSTGTGVSVYYLYVGTTGVGSNNVYSAGTGSGRSRTVTGIPSSGTIYVRLWSWTGSTWIYHDYTYS